MIPPAAQPLLPSLRRPWPRIASSSAQFRRSCTSKIELRCTRQLKYIERGWRVSSSGGECQRPGSSRARRLVPRVVQRFRVRSAADHDWFRGFYSLSTQTLLKKKEKTDDVLSLFLREEIGRAGRGTRGTSHRGDRNRCCNDRGAGGIEACLSRGLAVTRPWAVATAACNAKATHVAEPRRYRGQSPQRPAPSCQSRSTWPP